MIYPNETFTPIPGSTTSRNLPQQLVSACSQMNHFEKEYPCFLQNHNNPCSLLFDTTTIRSWKILDLSLSNIVSLFQKYELREPDTCHEGEEVGVDDGVVNADDSFLSKARNQKDWVIHLETVVHILQSCLSTHEHIVISRRYLLLSIFDEEHSLSLTEENLPFGLVTSLIQILRFGIQIWLHSLIQAKPHKEKHDPVLVEDRIANTVETKLLLDILSLHHQVTTLDCVLGEELARGGTHGILHRFIQILDFMEDTISKHDHNPSCDFRMSEHDHDTLHDMKDQIYSFSQIPIFTSKLYFPVQKCPYLKQELIDRLPLMFDWTYSFYNQNNVRLQDQEVQHFHQQDTREHKYFHMEEFRIWIQQVTKKQTAQYDVGFVTWPSSVYLSLWLLQNADSWFQNKDDDNLTILELGSGCGLVGLVAAKIIAQSMHASISIKSISNITSTRKVILTDFNPVVIDNLRRNIVLNNVGHIAETAILDFYEQSGINDEGGWIETVTGYTDSNHGTMEQNSFHSNDDLFCFQKRSGVDLILAADVICKPSDSVSVAKSIYDVLIPGGKAVVISANSNHRYGVEIFTDECVKVGLEVLETDIQMPCRNSLNGPCNRLEPLFSQTSGFIHGMGLIRFDILKPKHARLPI